MICALFLLFITSSSAITIDCNFRTIFLTMDSGYGCDGTATNDGSSQISTINGIHQAGRSNNDTEVFRVWNVCTLELVPQKIGIFFPNLIALWFNDCKFKELVANDFVNLTNLVELDLAYNQLEFVHEKAFENLRNLQFLYLNNNRIIFVGPNLIQTLPSLVFATLEDNSCISSNSFNFEDSNVRNFIIDVAIQCPLTLKIAESLLSKRNTEESRKFIKDLREVMDNAMFVDDEVDDEEVIFDDYRSSEPNDDKGFVKSHRDELEVINKQNMDLLLISDTNKLHESMKAKIKEVVLTRCHL
ncbi:unnamed protein product [Chironomus riparius]|uniref:Uncharacterized protein n=1 Tax=Chironomus riparius TaxID=315576 RepID=A0A9N9WWR4_9DIPT|nr:unnamed protein product [Chironomus riparius]